MSISEKINSYLDNGYINIVGAVGVIGAPFVDYLAEEYGRVPFVGFTIILIVMFGLGVFLEYKKRKKFKTDVIHIPIVIKVEDGPKNKTSMNDLFMKIEEKYSLKNQEHNLKKYFKITRSSLVFEYKGSIYDFDNLMNFTRIIKYNISKIEEQVDGRAKFHIAYYRRPAVGLLIGTIFRTESIVVYQNNDCENKFYNVSEIVSRKYKEQVKEYTKYTVSEDLKNQENKEVLVFLESASHNIAEKNVEFDKFENRVKIKLNSNGTIPYDDDWVEYEAEIYSVLNNLQTKFDKITLAHAMPEAIALILGMAIENYWNMDVLQYDNSEYKYIFNMKKIKYFS